jgi:hypothetical protein
LGEHSKRLLEALKAFRSQYGEVLPPLAVERLDEFFRDDGPLIEKPYENESATIPHGIVVLVALAAELEQLVRPATTIAVAS